MIDIENELFTNIATALRSEFSGIYVSGEYVPQPPKFPAVAIVEMDNSVYQSAVDSGAIENFATVTYQVDVYSNKVQGKKAECKNIIAHVDDLFAQYGFTRIFMQPVQNMNDTTVYRMTGRYRGIVSRDHQVYGR